MVSTDEVDHSLIVHKLKAVLFGTAQEYSEPAMMVRAAVFMLPTALIALTWEPAQWWRALILWALSTFMTYRYGLWARDDEDS